MLSEIMKTYIWFCNHHGWLCQKTIDADQFIEMFFDFVGDIFINCILNLILYTLFLDSC